MEKYGIVHTVVHVNSSVRNGRIALENCRNDPEVNEGNERNGLLVKMGMTRAEETREGH